jgi:Fe-S oxidoreductase
VQNGELLESAELDAALSNCLSCKACTTECPSNVNMALLKAELSHARIAARGLSMRERLLSSVDLLGRVGSRMPRLANWMMESLVVRSFPREDVGPGVAAALAQVRCAAV